MFKMYFKHKDYITIPQPPSQSDCEYSWSTFSRPGTCLSQWLLLGQHRRSHPANMTSLLLALASHLWAPLHEKCFLMYLTGPCLRGMHKSLSPDTAPLALITTTSASVYVFANLFIVYFLNMV